MTRVEASGRVFSYDETEVLGRGMFGVVYGGLDDAGQDVAIKVIALGADPEGASRRRREVKVATALGPEAGPHVMRYLAVGETDKHCVLVMPRAARSLGAATTGPWEPAAAIDVVRAMLVGLVTLEELGVIHRDLKPANVLELDTTWLLADFGLSRLSSAVTSANTMAGFGTEGYFAPELWRGDVPTNRSDLYAVGCIAFELATGRPPFGSSDPRPGHLNQPVAPLPDPFTGTYERLMRRLLAKHPTGRPASAAHALTWLDEDPGDAVTEILDLLAARNDEEQAARLAHEARRRDEAALETAAIEDLHDVIDRAAAALRALDPDAEAAPSHGEVGSRELRGYGDTLVVEIHSIRNRAGVDLLQTVLSAEVRLAGTNNPVASLLCTVRDGQLRWDVWQFRSSRPGAQPRPFGLGVQKLLAAVRHRQFPEQVSLLGTEALSVPAILRLLTHRESSWV